MTLRGSLEEASLADVLQLLSLGRKTGLLTMESGGQEAQVFFDNGRIAYATIDDRASRLGEILFKTGKITLEQRDQAVLLQSGQPSKKVGEVLVEIGAIDRPELEKYIRLQIEQTVYTLFNWQKGEFNFERGVTPDDQDVLVSMDPEGLLLEGARRTDEWGVIEKKIPSLNIVFSVDRDRVESADLNLTENQQRLIPLLDGTRDISTLVEETGLVEFEVGKSVYGLITAGLAWSVGRTSGQRQANGSHIEPDERRVSTETARKEHLTVAQLIVYMAKTSEFQTLAKRREAALHIVDCPQCAARLTGIHRRRSSKVLEEPEPKSGTSAPRVSEVTVPQPVIQNVPKKRPAHPAPSKAPPKRREERRRKERRVMERRWPGDRRCADDSDAVERRVAARRMVNDRRQGERRARVMGGGSQQVATAASVRASTESPPARTARPDRKVPVSTKRQTVAGRTKGRRSEQVAKAPKAERSAAPSTTKPKKAKRQEPAAAKTSKRKEPPTEEVLGTAVSRDLTPRKDEKARASEQIQGVERYTGEATVAKPLAPLPVEEVETTSAPAVSRRRSRPKRLSEMFGRRIDGPIVGAATKSPSPRRWPKRPAVVALAIGAVGVMGWFTLPVLQGGSDSQDTGDESNAVALRQTATPIVADPVIVDSPPAPVVADDPPPIIESRPDRSEEPPPTRHVAPPADAPPVVAERPPARVQPEPEPPVVDMTPAPVPTRGHLEGTVRNARTDQPVAGAVVRIDSLGVSATTDGAGAFSFADLEAGTFTISVTGDGLLTTTEAVDVAIGETVHVTIALRGPPIALNPDTVLDAEQWTEANREQAESRLGRPIPVIGGMWIESFAQPSSGTRPRVRVAHLMESGERIILIVTRSGPAVRPPNPRLTALRVMPASEAFPETTGTASYGGLVVTATASLSADELKTLLVGLTELIGEEDG